MASTYFKRTGTTTVNTYTFSAWIKIGTLSVANNTYQVLFSSGNQNILGLYGGGTTSGHNALYHYNNNNLWWTNNLLRDPSAWYNVVVKVSGGTVTSYINGVQTSYATSTYSLGALETTTDKTCVGVYAPSTSSFFRGSMSHVHFIDGTAYDASYFGSTDSVTGEWKINTSPSVNYGTDGFAILKDGMTITDQSSNSNDFTLGGGTLTATKDCPDNNFSVLNSAVKHTGTLTHGNKFYGTTGTSWIGIPATLGVETGKFYWEYKLKRINNWNQNGIVSQAGYNGLLTTYVGNITNSVAMNTGGGDIYTAGGSAQAWFGSARTQGQIIGIALDCDNNKIYWSCDGVWGNSSNPSNGTNGYSIPSALSNDKPYFPAASVNNCDVEYNFGDGYYGTTPITTNSGNGYAGAEGKSKFNYQPPTGYSALTTLGLNE